MDVEEQQQGQSRAQYGKQVIKKLSETLTEKLGRGFSVDTLDNSQPFMLPWSHYLLLMRIKNPDERSFYEIEATQAAWSIRVLQRQYNYIFAAEYALYLPDKKVLQKKLKEWIEEKGEE